MKKLFLGSIMLVSILAGWGCSSNTTLPSSGGQVEAMGQKPPGPSWQVLGSWPLTITSASQPSLFVYNGTPYVAFLNGTFNNVLSVVSLNGSTWDFVGNIGVSPGTANSPSLFVSNGTPYVAFQDATNSNKGTVMTYNGSSWNSLGNFSQGEADTPSISVFAGVIYVAFEDYANGQKASVASYYSPYGWSYVDNPGFSPGTAVNTTMADENGTIDVAFEDGANGNKATVMTYNGSWVNLGSADFSQTTAANLALSVSPGNAGGTFVAFMDPACNGLSVMKYAAGSWGYVGGECSAGVPAAPSLFAYNGTPYLAFTDGLRDVTVNAYQGGWGTIGKADFGGPATAPLSLFVYNGTPYVAFQNSSNKLTVMVYTEN